jgi:uncharacterized membrane protein YgdD (TMEM256/DUF423 family)
MAFLRDRAGESFRENQMHNLLGLIAALSGFIAVAAGAFGAHGLRQRLDAGMLDVWQTAVAYQLYHSLALLAIAAIPGLAASRLAVGAGWLFAGGIVLFSGSLYILALSGTRWLGMVTPLGGLLWLTGWLLLAVAFVRG